MPKDLLNPTKLNTAYVRLSAILHFDHRGKHSDGPILLETSVITSEVDIKSLQCPISLPHQNENETRIKN